MKGWKSKSKSGANQTDSKLSVRTAARNPNKPKSKSGAKQADSKLSVKTASRKPNKPKMPKGPMFPLSDFAIYVEESGFDERFREEHPDIKSFDVINKAGIAEWNSLSDAEKAPYVEEHEKRMKVYEEKREEFKKRFAEFGKSMAAYLDKKLADGEGPTDTDDDSDAQELLFEEDINDIAWV